MTRAATAADLRIAGRAADVVIVGAGHNGLVAALLLGRAGLDVLVLEESFGFADRLPYATPVDGLYSASAGCHPAGAVIGAAGHNAALRVLRDLGRPTA